MHVQQNRVRVDASNMDTAASENDSAVTRFLNSNAIHPNALVLDTEILIGHQIINFTWKRFSLII